MDNEEIKNNLLDALYATAECDIDVLIDAFSTLSQRYLSTLIITAFNTLTRMIEDDPYNEKIEGQATNLLNEMSCENMKSMFFNMTLPQLQKVQRMSKLALDEKMNSLYQVLYETKRTRKKKNRSHHNTAY